jgi:hypothetical protein
MERKSLATSLHASMNASISRCIDEDDEDADDDDDDDDEVDAAAAAADAWAAVNMVVVPTTMMSMCVYKVCKIR